MDDEQVFEALEELRNWRDSVSFIPKERAIQRAIDKKVEILRKRYGKKCIRFSVYLGNYYPLCQTAVGDFGGILRTVDEYVYDYKLGW